MADTLAKIIARKRRDIGERSRKVPLAALYEAVRTPTRSLAQALSARRVRFILECKRASPSAGVLRPDLDPRAIARAYAGVADAVSVVTDEPFFGGSLAMLRAVREEVTVPVLCKDFVIDPYQIVEARAHGADAILLMLSVLGDREALECLRVARTVGMECLVEVHDELELARALALPAPILGINNRDLRTLAIDLAVTERLAPRVPRERLLVCESGIQSHEDVERLAPLVDGFLVGSSLMRRADVADAARELVTGRVKVCGLTRPEDARVAARAGARFAGVIFAPSSRRLVTRDQAATVVAAAPLPAVGVFADQPPAFVAETAKAIGLHAVQLHGGEDGGYVEALRRELPAGCEVWKVAAMAPGRPAPANATGADRLLFDTCTPRARGGTGETFSWESIRDHEALSGSVLAGGLNPDNAGAARRVGAWALDVSSGIEIAPGQKSAIAVEQLFDSLRVPGRRALGAR